MERVTNFADVILPLSLPGYYTYRVPYEMNDVVQPGMRVVVQFGKKKIYTAIVRKVHSETPKVNDIKYILSILENDALVTEKQMQFWEWISSYYMCTPGEVMKAALPSALKLESETKIILNPSFDGDISLLTEKELLIAEALSKQKALTITDVTKIADQKKIIPLIKTLIEKNVIIPEEELVSRYKPKTETFVKISESYLDDIKLKDVFDKLEKKAPKQLEILMYLYSKRLKANDKPLRIIRSEMLKTLNTSSAQLNALIKKGICEQYTHEISRLEEADESNGSTVILNEVQENAYNEVIEGFTKKDIVLLHGITSSGKTEIYIKLIEEAVNKGKQVLYLLPEIALTTQIINRLRKAFGKKVGVYHSKFNESERVEIWNKVLLNSSNITNNEETYQIVLGARSSSLLPYSNLGLVIVDEEHDTSYKQYEPAPRYNARDSAIYLAKMHGAKTILGSATPSVESYFNAIHNKYQLVEINKRFGDVMLPEIFVADVKEESRRRRMKSHFTPFLLEHIEEALKNKEQVILFQNRRGFSIRLECDICHWMPECKNCDVTLTYHKKSDQLVCHYCGYTENVPDHCPACNNNKVLMKGFGTEKIEEELPIFFPGAKVVRMDLDTTRSKYSHQQIINDFEDRKIDILVGTQMVTKGLDFENVSVVGIMNADNMISFPDFRSFERSYQMMAQVSGRAGRKNKRGKVIIQTYNPYHSVIRYVVENNYTAMYESQITERATFKYPPVCKLIQLTLKHKDAEKLNKSASAFAKNLRKVFGSRILGPEYPSVSKIRNEYLKNILIKIEKDYSISQAKSALRAQIENFKNDNDFKGVKIVIDVDPM
ncbi:MAG TPA: primosomal protein N' [Bacteroidales bacterium]|nr:primosomal protein N' [Bacteroidales bacterium]HPS16444.1 primosomal protein N' [Bacteroidales bacterium]